MNRFLVQATFKADTNMAEVFATVADEQAHVEALRTAERLGALFVSLPRQTVFLETFAANEGDALATIGELPLSRFWNLDVYPAPLDPMAVES
jgi:hypothetical protein